MNIEIMNESYAMAFLVTEYNTQGRFCADVIESYRYENTKLQHIFDKTIIRVFVMFFPLIFHLLVAPGYIKLYYIRLSCFYTKKGYYIVG